jgi:hypothetical protein
MHSIPCVQIGIELAAQDYNFHMTIAFKKVDIISLIPVHKVHCLSVTSGEYIVNKRIFLDTGRLIRKFCRPSIK